MSSYKGFDYQVQDGIGTVTFTRPDKLNSLTFEVYAELERLAWECQTDDAVRVLVLTGTGKGFCSGGDVHEIIGPLTRMDDSGLIQFTRMTGDLVRAMRTCPQPIVAAVEGVCAGAGAIIAMASDLRLAAPNAKTAFLFTRVGLSGADMGACAILPRIIGHGRAAELLFTGRSMSAEEGERWGFFSRIVDDVQAEALALARELASGPVQAHYMTKRQLDAEWHVSIETALDMEAEAQAGCMKTRDFHRAYEAFANKRKPEFQGD
jgi:enoyl-CoA hydratase/carnithine racemase